MWILSHKGSHFSKVPANRAPVATKRLEAGEPDLSLNETGVIEINFPSSADGRGFSLARRLRRLRGAEVKLVATGSLLPDQARMALQCGFDEIWLDDELVHRHGQAPWREAIENAATNLYITNTADRLATASGWDQRHQDRGQIKSLTAAETYDRLKKIPNGKILDVRTSAEVLFVGQVIYGLCAFVQWKGFPDGSVNPDFVLEVEKQGLSKNCEIFVLCRSGVRSLDAAKALQTAGYKNLTNICDGFEGDLNAQGRRGTINGWKASGLPWQQQ